MKGVDWIAQIAALSRDAGDRVQWQPPVNPADCVAREAAYRIKLPGDYKDVLQRIGNGCTGLLEVFPLGLVEGGSGLVPLATYVSAGDLARPFKYKTGRYWKTGELSGGDDDEDEPLRGAFPVADNQCGGEVVLVVTGKDRGLMWEQESGYYTPAASPVVRSLTFAEWCAVELAKRLGRKDLLAAWRG